MTEPSRSSDIMSLSVAIAAIGLITAFRPLFHLTNPTTAALSYLLVILVTATVATLWVAVMASIVADLSLNYFFMPPVATFAIADPENWIALSAFLAVSLIASNLSSTARQRAREATARGNELARLLEERTKFLEERRKAELARQSEELKSALLASLSHDLRTPLTAIRVAASNLRASWLADGDRREQSDVVLAEVDRLNRLFQNILEMTRIDAGAVAAEARWVHPSEIVEAARDHVEHILGQRRVEITVDADMLVRVDPRLTASALAHVLENAAQYTESGSPIQVRVVVSDEGLVMTVRDHGPGIALTDLPHLFERFYRGTDAKVRVPGTGMGLSIARGMLAAEGGRISAENCADRGAQFTIVVPAESRLAMVEQTS